MARSNTIVRYSSDDLTAMRARGESRTDWARSAAMTDEALEASIAADPDEAGMEFDWTSATTMAPQPDAALNVHVDPDLLAFFRQGGADYQGRINAVLRAYVEDRGRTGQARS